MPRDDAELPVLRVQDPRTLLDATPPLPAPGEPADPRSIADWARTLLEHANHLHSPRYVGHQVNPPWPGAALLESVSALLNNGMAVFEMGPMQTAMEHRAVRWMADRLGFPDSAGGVFTHGGSVGNLTALLAARQAHAGDVWNDGLANRPQLAVMTSEQSHYCVTRSMQIMGHGAAGTIKVPADDAYRMRPEAMEVALKRAKDAGTQVFAVIASACTTATGSFDPLPEIASFCRDHGLWMHADAAHGASFVLSESTRELLRGIELADSVVWDAHKMMLMPALITGVIFREAKHSAGAFAQEASYLFEGTPQDEWWNVGHRTLECTKRGMGATFYAVVSALGPDLFSTYVAKMVELAKHFARQIDLHSHFETALPPEANIVCFRYLPNGETPVGDDTAQLDALQADLRRKVLASGTFYIVQTRLPHGVFLRVTIINPRTSEATLDALLETDRRDGRDGRGCRTPEVAACVEIAHDGKIVGLGREFWPRSKNACANAHHRRARCNRRMHVGGHAHAEFRQSEP